MVGCVFPYAANAMPPALAGGPADAIQAVRYGQRDPLTELASGGFDVLSRGRWIGAAWYSRHLPGFVWLTETEILRVRALDRGAVALIKLATRRYLSVNMAGVVTLKATAIGPDEMLTLSPAVHEPAPPVIAALDRLFGAAPDLPAPEKIIALAGSGDPALHEVAAQLLYGLPADSVLPLIEPLARLSGYGTAFPAIRDVMNGHAAPFAPLLTARLATAIKRFGWTVGAHSYGSPRIIEPELGQLTIGKYCSFNEIVVILGNHVTRAATSYPFADLRKYWPTAAITPDLTDHEGKDVVIGNDVWIGNGALVLPGTRIGDGAVIGAHAVARGEIPPYAVLVGNPGRIAHFRFDSATIARLLRVAWWNWPDHEVDRAIPLLLGDIEMFLRRAEAAMPAPEPAGLPTAARPGLIRRWADATLRRRS